jgi:ubiquitin-conjugating enzyme E2 O
LGRYFCEPAYEKFRGTNEGALNSRLYNEKAYVLSRGFILRALEKPPSSLEDEIRGFYLSSPSLERVEAEDVMDQDQDQERGEGSSQGQGGGQRRLEKVLKNSEELISLSYALQQQSQPQTVPFGQGQPADLAGPPPIPDEDAAVPKLTAGGILTLRRVLIKLSDIQRNHPQRLPGTAFMSN